MLRPSEGLLGSSKAARRASLRAERLRTVFQLARVVPLLVSAVVRVVVDLVLLCGLPIAYLISAYFAFDVPGRWLAHRGASGGWGALAFLVSAAVCLVGISRAVQNAPPIAPVRPQFAKAMLALSFVTGLLLTLGDLAS